MKRYGFDMGMTALLWGPQRSIWFVSEASYLEDDRENQKVMREQKETPIHGWNVATLSEVAYAATYRLMVSFLAWLRVCATS